MDPTTRSIVPTFALTLAAFAAVGVLAACSEMDDDRDDCRKPQSIVMFFGTDGHYHYGSPTGKVVPAAKVPAAARKVPGYKPPAAPKVSVNKPPVKAPAPVKIPAPAPRPPVKVGR